MYLSQQLSGTKLTMSVALTPEQTDNTDNDEPQVRRHDRKVDQLGRNKDTPKIVISKFNP